MSEFARFEKTFIYFLNIMAFITNVREFQALLDACSSTHDWELLLESILIPDEWIPMAYARLSELATQELDTGKYSIPSLNSFLMTVYV